MRILLTSLFCLISLWTIAGEVHYSLNCPPSWIRIQTPDPASFYILGPSSQISYYRPTLVMQHQKLSKRSSIAHYSYTLTQNWEASLENFSLKGYQQEIIQKANFQTLSYEYTERDVLFKAKNFLTIKGKSVYTICYSAPKESYNVFYPDALQILESLDIKDVLENN